jgi:hypothetical protein
MLVALLIATVAFAGCTGTTNSQPTETALQTTTETRVAGATDNATADDPAKGDELLYVSAVNKSTVKGTNDSAKANFSALSDTQSSVFLDALEDSSGVTQTVFEYGDEDRIRYVRYDGQWYYLRVAIV